MAELIADDCWICVDCVMAIANGDMPEDKETRERVEKGLTLEDGCNWVLGDGENEFSWSSCDCCGSSLGGSRHEAAIIK